ncbi:MAG: SpoIIE family protein phosphatase [Sumerlaeia bacterium]
MSVPTPFPANTTGDLQSAKHRVVLVDTLTPDSALMKATLQANGYDVLCCVNGDDVVHQVGRQGADLVLLPSRLSDNRPADVTRELRKRQGRGQNLPILMLVSDEDFAARATGLEAGADDFLFEPVDPQLLSARVASHLKIKFLHDRLAEARATLDRKSEQMTRVRSRLIPEALPQFRNLRSVVYFEASGRDGSGDGYGALALPDGRVAYVVWDVKGSGLQALVHSAMAQAVLRCVLARGLSPAQTLQEMNKTLLSTFDSEELMTCYIAVVDPESGTLVHSAAGHPSPILHLPEEDRADLLEPAGGPPLGIFDDITYHDSLSTLPIGGRLILMTNGILHGRDGSGETYGTERLISLLSVTGDMDLEEALDLVTGDVSSHIRGEVPHDDLTLILIERTGGASGHTTVEA